MYFCSQSGFPFKYKHIDSVMARGAASNNSSSAEKRSKDAIKVLSGCPFAWRIRMQSSWNGHEAHSYEIMTQRIVPPMGRPRHSFSPIFIFQKVA